MIRYSSFNAIPSFLLQAYFAAVLLMFLYFIVKHHDSLFRSFIIFLFFPGLFSFYDVLGNPYKIIIVVLGIYLMMVKRALNTHAVYKYRWVVYAFVLFTISFLYSGYLNKDDMFMIFSQYSKYLIIFLSFFIISNEFEYYPSEIPKHARLVYSLIIVQIVLAIIKLLLIGVMESIVSSLSFRGGALGTVFPIVAFIFIWTARKGKMTSQDWLVVVGLLIVGFASNKRAIWFILPGIIFLYSTYVAHRKLSAKVWVLIALLPLIFYMGVRLNPSLNKERKIWGSFDMDYAIGYADQYTFGRKDVEEKGQGRGGATLLLIEKISSKNLTKNDLFGYGIEKYNASDYDEFENYDFGINHKGAATGFFQTYIATGFVGALMMVLLIGTMFTAMWDGRFTFALVAVFVWEYFLYTGILLRMQILMFLVIFFLMLRRHLKLNRGFKKQDYYGKPIDYLKNFRKNRHAKN